MPLYLVNPAVDMTLELYVSEQLEEALTIQYERIKDGAVRSTFVKHLERRLQSLLADSVDWDLKKPTEAQLSYARLIAKQLGLELPSEVKRSRFHAAMFLETHAERMRSLGKLSGEPPAALDGEQAAAELVAARVKGRTDG